MVLSVGAYKCTGKYDSGLFPWPVCGYSVYQTVREYVVGVCVCVCAHTHMHEKEREKREDRY